MQLGNGRRIAERWCAECHVIAPGQRQASDAVPIFAEIGGSGRFDQTALDYLVETHYKSINRPFRCCQPRDLLLQIVNYCHYISKPPEMSTEYFDYAVANYFAVM